MMPPKKIEQQEKCGYNEILGEYRELLIPYSNGYDFNVYAPLTVRVAADGLYDGYSITKICCPETSACNLR
jgi:hypothetical protein